MFTIKDLYPDLSIPDYFRVRESSSEWRIVHRDYGPEIDSLLDRDNFTGSSAVSGGRGRNPVVKIKGGEVVVRTYRRGGPVRFFLPDIFADARRPLDELVITEKGRQSGAPLPEILGLQIRWVLPPLFRARIISRKIPDAITLEEFIVSVLANYRTGKAGLYDKKRCLIKSLSQSTGKLHQAGIFHNDLNIRNILVRQDQDDKIDAYIIDLDKSICRKGLALDERVNNLIRLNRSFDRFLFRNQSAGLSGIISSSDRLFLLEEYLREDRISNKEKRSIIKQCLRQSALHKWWWGIIRLG